MTAHCQKSRKIVPGAFVIGLLVLVMAPGSLASGPESKEQPAAVDADFQKLLAEKADAIITVKFVLKLEGGFGDNEDEREISGVMIEPNGLVLCSNLLLSGPRFFRGAAATPTDIKVLIGDDTEGVKGELVARDSELDLTWIRITEPAAEPYSAIDLTVSAEPRVGERMYSLSRMGKYFDRVAVVSVSRLGGVTTKPRRLFVPGNGAGSLGLPIFNADGAVLGVVVSQMPAPEEMEASGFGWRGASGLILPAEEVVRATRRAKELVAETDEDE